MSMNTKRISQEFDVGENEDVVIFPARWVSGKPIVMVRKDQFKVHETDTMIILTNYEPSPITNEDNLK